MKRILTYLPLLIAFLFCGCAQNIPAGHLTGGDTDALDHFYTDGESGYYNALADGDYAMVTTTAGVMYNYIYDIDNAGAESSPDIITPDESSAGVAYAGDARWILMKTHVATPTGNAHATTKVYVDGKTSDTAYDVTAWDGVTTIAPSKNAVRDQFQAQNEISELSDVTIAGAALYDFLCWDDAGGYWENITRAVVLERLSGQADADFSMNIHKITSVTDPTANQDAATKKYVDDNCQPVDADLTSLAALATSGGAAFRTAGDTWTLRDIMGTANEITVANGDGIAGAPTIAAHASITRDAEWDTWAELPAMATEVIDSDHYIDASIDHEHLAPDVISGLADVTSADADYILIWDATDSALKKCDMGEVRGGAGATAWDNITNPDANKALDFTNYYTSMDFGDTDHDMFTLFLTGAFGDVSGFVIEQKTGNPTDGTLLELKLASGETDPDFFACLANTSTVFKIEADGAVTGKSFTSAKVSGTAGKSGVYEANGAETCQTGWEGAASIADDMWFKYSNADPTANAFMLFGAPAAGISAITWTTFDADDFTITSNTLGLAEDKKRKTIIIKIQADDTALTTSDEEYVTVPETLTGYDLKAVGGHVYNTGTTVSRFQVTNVTDGQAMLSTLITIDATEKDSTTAGAQPVVDGSHDDVVTADELAITCTTAGTGAKGGEFRLIFEKP